MGYVLIDCPIFTSKTGTNIELIVYHKEFNIGTQDCIKILSVMEDIIKIELDNKNTWVSVSSPGLERKIQYNDEFGLFISRLVRIVDNNNIEYLGVIKSVSENEVSVEYENLEIKSINFSGIKSAKLVFIEDKSIYKDDDLDTKPKPKNNKKNKKN